MAGSSSGDQHPSTTTSPATALQARLKAVIPHALTACVSVALALLLQAVLLPPSAAGPPPAVVSPAATAAPTATPTPTVPSPVGADTSSSSTDVPATAAPTATPAITASPENSQIAELQQEVSRLWSAYYLARAASQLADAEAALRVNELAKVEQVLTTVGASLDRAYDRSPEQEKGPISEFRAQVGRMHADLHIRPNGMDLELQRLRQSMLSLVDERG